MACTSPFDVLRQKAEDLGPDLYALAMGRSWWHKIIPRGTWPEGRGFQASVFTIARSAPSLQESPWQAIQAIGQGNANGACNVTYNQAYVGELERRYYPEMLGIRGPVVCQDDLTMYWNSRSFWTDYFERLVQVSSLEISDRHQTAYNSMVPHYGFVGGNILSVPSKANVSPPPQWIDLTDYLPGGAIGLPDSELTQENLDFVAAELISEGAHLKETGASRWITMGDNGPNFPLDIGIMASRRISTNNPEYRADINAGFQGWGMANPTLQEIGASKLLGNFRHIPNPFPARYIYVPYGVEVVFTCLGSQSSLANCIWSFYNFADSGTIQKAAGYPVAQNALVPGAPVGSATGADMIVRVPLYCWSLSGDDVTKGQASVRNGAWNDANIVTLRGENRLKCVKLESATVLNPFVMEEEPLIPVNSAPSMKWTPQNYYGVWAFVNGNDAFLGMDSCTGIPDPMRVRGRHFCQFRHAYKQKLPTYGAFMLFLQCPGSMSRVLCS